MVCCTSSTYHRGLRPPLEHAVIRSHDLPCLCFTYQMLMTSSDIHAPSWSRNSNSTLCWNTRMVHSTKSNSNLNSNITYSHPHLFYATKFRLIPTQIGQAPLFWLWHSSKCHCFCHSRWLPATCTQFCEKNKKTNYLYFFFLSHRYFQLSAYMESLEMRLSNVMIDWRDMQGH